VLEHIQRNPTFIQPEARRNEVISKLNQGVEDLSISRATLKWGIPMPHDPEHVLYVWIDALSNYITALGYGQGDDGLFKKFWPADVHLIGKEIMWFHVVYWPAMLFSLGLEPPRRVYAHGWWTAEGRKMSKTLGNFIDLERLRVAIGKYGLDGLRYYLFRAAPFGNDLDWKDDELAAAHNELANVIGNCLNRIMTMVPKYRGTLPAAGDFQEIDRALIEKTQKLPSDLAGAYQRLELQQCALLPIELARATNGYIEATAPFKLAKDAAQATRLDTVLNVAAQAVYASLVALLPVLPDKAAAGLAQMGIDVAGKTLPDLFSTPLPAGAQFGQGTPLFPRLEVK
jgi:methionyl-tRNA synthetase